MHYINLPATSIDDLWIHIFRIIIISHSFSLFLIGSHYVSLCLIISHYFSLFLIGSHYVSLCLISSNHFSLYIYHYSSVLIMYLSVLSLLLVFSLSSLWFQVIWKIWVKLDHLPQFSGWQFQKYLNHHPNKSLTWSLQWTTLLKWMSFGYHYFWKHPFSLYTHLFCYGLTMYYFSHSQKIGIWCNKQCWRSFSPEHHGYRLLL